MRAADRVPYAVACMEAVVLTLLHLAVTTAKLCRPGGVRAVVAENLLLKQQLIVLRRPRQRAPNLTTVDRLLCGFGSLFLWPGRLRKVAIGVRPSTLLAFHRALVRRKYRRFASQAPIAAMREFFPLIHAGLVINVATGLLLVVARASEALVNPAFYVTIAAIALALVQACDGLLGVWHVENPAGRRLPQDVTRP